GSLPDLRASPAHGATNCHGAPASQFCQDLFRWHLRRNVHIVKKNRDLPPSVGTLLPDLQVSCARCDRPSTLLGCQREPVPPQVESDWTMNSNGTDRDCSSASYRAKSFSIRCLSTARASAP